MKKLISSILILAMVLCSFSVIVLADSSANDNTVVTIDYNQRDFESEGYEKLGEVSLVPENGARATLGSAVLYAKQVSGLTYDIGVQIKVLDSKITSASVDIWFGDDSGSRYPFYPSYPVSVANIVYSHTFPAAGFYDVEVMEIIVNCLDGDRLHEIGTIPISRLEVSY